MESVESKRDFETDAGIPMLSVVIPTYNESENIGLLIKQVHGVLKEMGYPFEVIVVDDDSPDKTWEVVQSFFDEFPELRLIRRRSERGLARSVLQGWRHAQGDILAVIDGDLQHPPETLTQLIKAVKDEGVDLAVASRNVQGGGVTWTSPIRRSVSWTATLMATWLLPGILATIRDPLSGYFAIRKSTIQRCHLNPEGYKILLEVLVRGQYSSVKEIPYVFVGRRWSTSKLGLRQYLQFLTHLYHLSRDTGELGRLAKFCVVGGSGVFVNMGTLMSLTAIGMGYFEAGIVSIETAIITNFLFNEYWSFSDFSNRSRGFASRFRRFINFNLFCAAGASIHLVILWTFTEYLNLQYLLSNFMGLIPATIWNYGMNANITWKSVRAERRT